VSRFTSALCLSVLEYSTGAPVLSGDRVLWCHASPLIWEVGALGSGRTIVVPSFDSAGLTDEQLRLLSKRRAVAPGVTDLASIPAAFRWFASPDGPWVKAAALHDFLYRTKGLYGFYTRAQCDAIFLEAMLAVGVEEKQARIIYEAVRLGGGAGWGS
jgi:hypothetical protein